TVMSHAAPLTLTINTRAPDQCRTPGMTGHALRNSVNEFLRRQGNDVYLHTNVVLGVRDGNGRDVAGTCRLLRQRRVWTVSTEHAAAIGAGILEQDWHDDNQGVRDGWQDAPGVQFSVANLGPGDMVHQAQEFFVFALTPDRLTALMGFYHFQILRFGRGGYRAQHSAGKPVSFFDWLSVRKLPRPWIAAAQVPMAADSGPQRF
ncbi:MAG TPA: hypothetical protein VD970_11895, partial [Acetobacteraceae bacterium]|nr:hypothetical protein [Acetobacteraceae bacterium]